MNKINIIIKREYINIVKKKSFLISAILTPILLLAMILVPTFLARVTVIRERKVALMDGTGYVFESLEKNRRILSDIAKLMEKHKEEQNLDKTIESEMEKTGVPSGQIGRFLRQMGEQMIKSFAAIKFVRVEPAVDKWESEKATQLDRIRKELIDVLIIVPANVENGQDAEYYSRSSGNFDEISLLERFITEAVVSKRLTKQGMDPEKVKSLTIPVGLKTSDVTKTGVKKGSFIRSYFTAVAFVMLIWTAVFTTGQQLMRGVLEEKNNRIIEILLSSLKPKQLMSGKILGLGGAGLTLVAIWVFTGILGMKLSGGLGVKIEPSMMVYFTVFFILGYLLFSTFMAILGAIFNTEQEAQQFITIISLSLIFPLFFAIVIIKDPNSTLAAILTLIPLFTPTMILFRSAIAPVPVMQVVVGIILLMLTIWLMIRITSKIFRVGILMYGKKPSVKEILKWMKYR